MALDLPEVLESSHMGHQDFEWAERSSRRSAFRTRSGAWWSSRRTSRSSSFRSNQRRSSPSGAARDAWEE